MLVKLVDGGIKNILTDSKSYPGCETCDYGSSYINNFNIKMTMGEIQIEVSQQYDHALSEGAMMEIILPNIDEIKTMTEHGFYKWLKEKVQEKVKAETYDFYHKGIKVEFKEG